MKLNELVKLRNDLRTSTQIDIIQEKIKENVQRLSNLCATSNPEYDKKIRELADAHVGLLEDCQDHFKWANGLADEVQTEIHEITKKYFTENYETELAAQNIAFIREMRKAHFPDEFNEILLSKIRIHSSWKYPALEIGCRDGEYTKFLVASDPLYIADEYDEFLENTFKQFTPEYQLRLRKYMIRGQKIFMLPKRQFNFIFSCNYFNYLSLDTIRQFLIQGMEWLRPGGTMIFTYNNGDIPESAGLSESFFMTYVPKSMLVPLVESLGFEVISTVDIEPSASFIEIRKHGTLQTVKAHQTLGEIVYR